jgi:hypothetical protein
MASRRVKLGWLSLMAALAGASCAAAQQVAPLAAPTVEVPALADGKVPLDEVAPADREHVRFVLDNPTLASHGQSEIFTCRPEHYYWLLDHPDQGVRLWRCLGVKCADIAEHGSYFTWQDGSGSNVRWQEVYHGTDRHVWYAEGKVNPGFLLPMATIKAVVVLNHNEGTDAAGRPAMRHRIGLTLHTDSTLVAAAAKLVGASVPKLAQQYVGQIQMFYGAMAWYLNQHPRHATVLFDQLQKPASSDRQLTLPTE